MQPRRWQSRGDLQEDKGASLSSSGKEHRPEAMHIELKVSKAVSVRSGGAYGAYVL